MESHGAVVSVPEAARWRGAGGSARIQSPAPVSSSGAVPRTRAGG